MFKLENDKTRIVIDENGFLIELLNKKTIRNYAGNAPLWRLIYQDGMSLEEELDTTNIVPQIEQKENQIILKYNESKNANLAFNMVISISLIDDNFTFDIDIENKDKSRVIRESHFPIIYNCNIKENDELYTTTFGGRRFENISKEIDKHHTLYLGQDNKEIQMSTIYPGYATMNYFLIASEENGLYFGSHDDTFQMTNHFVSKSHNGDINAAIIKYPFISLGETFTMKNAVISPYTGSWHIAAKKYRAWADSWYTIPEIPQSIKDMTSWHRIIMRHQYGKTLFKYNQLEEILKDGLEANFNTLFMFGWHNDGHDAGYPDYSCDENQGGFNGLKENIAKFQNGGGDVILYFNGRLIDVSSDYYHKHGKDVCIKRPDGSEGNDFYKFGGDGTGLRVFGNKSFVTACPSCDEWWDILKKHVDKAVALGCDGVFFDQLGAMIESAVCFDPNHGHKVPFTNIMAVTAEKIKELRAYVKSKNPKMSFGIEWISDITSQHVDFIHTIYQGTQVLNDWEKGEKPKSDMFLELFYYTFPEPVLSDRSIRDDTDIERRVNFALMKGLRSDVEIYRCRATIAETPHYQGYLAKVNILREKYKDIIMSGKYCDTDYFEIDNKEFVGTSFISENKLAVMVSQSHLKKADTILKVPGYKYIEHDGLNDYTLEHIGQDIKLSVNQHGLVLIILEKK